MSKDILEEYFALATQHKVPLFLKFTAAYCGPCKVIAPTFARLEQQYRDRAYFVIIDTASHPDIATQFGVRSIPAFAVVVGNNVVKRWVGIDVNELISTVHKYLPKE
jgi:thioredoxin-like negative regulator of GroEL